MAGAAHAAHDFGLKGSTMPKKKKAKKKAKKSARRRRRTPARNRYGQFKKRR